MIVVHLHNTKKGGTSTALLVDNTTTKQGTTVLLLGRRAGRTAAFVSEEDAPGSLPAYQR